MPMMALVNPVYDCLFRLAQPDSLRKEEEVSAGKWGARVLIVQPRTSKKHSSEGMQRGLVQRRALRPGRSLPPPFLLEEDRLDRRIRSPGGRMVLVLTPLPRLCPPFAWLFPHCPNDRGNPAVQLFLEIRAVLHYAGCHERKMQTVTPLFSQKQLLLQLNIWKRSCQPDLLRHCRHRR